MPSGVICLLNSVTNGDLRLLGGLLRIAPGGQVSGDQRGDAPISKGRAGTDRALRERRTFRSSIDQMGVATHRLALCNGAEASLRRSITLDHATPIVSAKGRRSVPSVSGKRAQVRFFSPRCRPSLPEDVAQASLRILASSVLLQRT